MTSIGLPKGLPKSTECKSMRFFQRGGSNERLRQGVFFAFGPLESWVCR